MGFRSKTLAAILLSLVFVPAFNFQAPGYADLTQPPQGGALVGLVTIEGSAAHPSFNSYDLMFALDPNPTDTWFPISENVQTSVSRGRLGIWDTTGVTDGTYQLRLRVWLQNGTSFEVINTGLRIRNVLSIETATPAPVAEIAVPTPLLPTSTPRPTPLPFIGEPGASRVVNLLLLGAIAGAASLGIFGTYSIIRGQIRRRWGAARSRAQFRESQKKRRRRDS